MKILRDWTINNFIFHSCCICYQILHVNKYLKSKISNSTLWLEHIRIIVLLFIYRNFLWALIIRKFITYLFIISLNCLIYNLHNTIFLSVIYEYSKQKALHWAILTSLNARTLFCMCNKSLAFTTDRNFNTRRWFESTHAEMRS